MKKVFDFAYVSASKAGNYSHKIGNDVAGIRFRSDVMPVFVARSNGKRVDGRPKKYKPDQMRHALELLEDNSYSEVEKMTGISKSTLIRAARALKMQQTSRE